MLGYGNKPLGIYGWTPEEQISNELQYFEGRDILPRRDIPNPEEIALRDIQKKGDKSPLVLSNLPKKARDLAIKSFGKPDNTTYEFLDGEIGEMTQQEKGYLTEAKDDKERKKREEIVRKIGEGKVNPKTGRKQYLIPIAVAAGAMIIGGVAKMVSGGAKRKAQRSAMRAEQAEIQQNIDATKQDFTGAKTMAGQEVQAQGRMDAITQKGQFDTFVSEAAKSVVPEGDYVKKQKGLQTGVGKENELIVEDAMKTSANTQTDIQMATVDQQNANNARSMDELQTTSDRILESLKRGKGQVGKQIKASKSNLNIFTDALSGSSQGLSLAANVYGGGGIG
jgi:actin-related protein